MEWTRLSNIQSHKKWKQWTTVSCRPEQFAMQNDYYQSWISHTHTQSLLITSLARYPQATLFQDQRLAPKKYLLVEWTRLPKIRNSLRGVRRQQRSCSQWTRLPVLIYHQLSALLMGLRCTTITGVHGYLNTCGGSAYVHIGVLIWRLLSMNISESLCW